MQPFTTLTAVAVPFDQANIDTNQLCPTRFNKVPIGAPEYPTILFHDQRFNPDGSEKPDFILNKAPYRKAQIVVADRNWGGGSSRESAVYALLAFGIRAIVASSFGDIHRSNCLKNGVLPVLLPNEICAALRQQLHAKSGAKLSIDLAAQTVTAPDGSVHRFEIAAVPKKCLLEGLDDVGRTQQYRSAIDAFSAHYRKDLPFQGNIQAS
jgi:3-isopropylmalate/(R)-2-methylmalate dehydratase small subunit